MIGISAPKSAPFRQSLVVVVERRVGAGRLGAGASAGSIALQYSKWPISSETPTFVVCAAHVVPRGTAE